MVLDLSLAMEQHRSHFKSLQWTQFRLMSHYHETENITVRISGRNGKGSVLLLDDFVVTLETLDMTKELVKIIFGNLNLVKVILGRNQTMREKSHYPIFGGWESGS